MFDTWDSKEKSYHRKELGSTTFLCGRMSVCLFVSLSFGQSFKISFKSQGSNISNPTLLSEKLLLLHDIMYVMYMIFTNLTLTCDSLTDLPVTLNFTSYLEL